MMAAMDGVAPLPLWPRGGLGLAARLAAPPLPFPWPSRAPAQHRTAGGEAALGSHASGSSERRHGTQPPTDAVSMHACQHARHRRATAPHLPCWGAGRLLCAARAAPSAPARGQGCSSTRPWRRPPGPPSLPGARQRSAATGNTAAHVPPPHPLPAKAPARAPRLLRSVRLGCCAGELPGLPRECRRCRRWHRRWALPQRRPPSPPAAPWQCWQGPQQAPQRPRWTPGCQAWLGGCRRRPRAPPPTRGARSAAAASWCGGGCGR